MAHQEHDADLILPNLWLGNYKVAVDRNFLEKYNIQYIVNVTTEIPSVFPGLNYFNLRVDRKFCGAKMNMMIDQAVDFIQMGLNRNCGVLVHCRKGHHRSASIVLAYLIKYKATSFEDGLKYIRYLRPTTFKRSACMVVHAHHYYLWRKQGAPSYGLHC